MNCSIRRCLPTNNSNQPHALEMDKAPTLRGNRTILRALRETDRSVVVESHESIERECAWVNGRWRNDLIVGS